MDSLISGGGIEKKTFLNHIFSTTEEGKAEIFNVLQYALLAIIPVVCLNKSVQYFIPDFDIDKSSFFILAEIFLQISFIFISFIFIHRFITFFPTFSGFKYDSFSFSSFIIPFFIIIFSIQSKLANKINLILFRAKEMLGFDIDENDEIDNKPVQNNKINYIQGNENNKNEQNINDSYFGPMAANSLLGGSF